MQKLQEFLSLLQLIRLIKKVLILKESKLKWLKKDYYLKNGVEILSGRVTLLSLL